MDNRRGKVFFEKPAISTVDTAQKMKFSMKIWSHLLKKGLMQIFIFCAVGNSQPSHISKNKPCNKVIDNKAIDNPEGFGGSPSSRETNTLSYELRENNKQLVHPRSNSGLSDSISF